MKNIALDDFSFLKRKTYYTILVDNNSHKRLEVIPSRQKADIVEILAKFSKVETVTRDFSKAYRAAIKEALPKAKQIVDRFHILKNLTDDVIEYLKKKLKDKIKIFDKSSTSMQEKEILNRREKDKVETGLRKWKIVEEVHRLKVEGKSNTEIAKLLHLTRPTVIKYIGIKEPPIASRSCILDPFVPRIKELIQNGYSNTDIFLKIKEEGYPGERSLYNSKIKGIHCELKHKVRYLKRSDIKNLLFYPIEKIKDVDKKRDLDIYLTENIEVKKVLDLVASFKRILLGKDCTKLESWLKEAKAYNISEIDSFVKLIRGDIEAVTNAIIYDYSNGLTEGHNNKIKLIKRQMYGRCKFELLRLKILT